MLITIFKHELSRQRRRSVIAVFVLSMTGWLFLPASADEECATDFFSQQTCRSFDAIDWGVRQSFDYGKSAEGAALWDGYSGLSGSQIWYRNPFDGNWMSMTLPGRGALGNPAIHGFRCLADLFGNVVCSRKQPIPEATLGEKSPGHR